MRRTANIHTTLYKEHSTLRKEITLGPTKQNIFEKSNNEAS